VGALGAGGRSRWKSAVWIWINPIVTIDNEVESQSVSCIRKQDCSRKDVACIDVPERAREATRLARALDPCLPSTQMADPQ
jgi:hypothetical protein